MTSHPAGLEPTLGGTPAPALPSPNYDEQAFEIFSQSFSSLAYNVTAIAQTDSNGYGPAYLLNGLTPQGYWYQVGVQFNWPEESGSVWGFIPGFAMAYETFNPSGNSIFPAGGGGGDGNFSGPVSSGDSILLSLSFSGGDVIMNAHDWNTGATAQEAFSAEGSTDFKGGGQSGFFTGLMTEWYHATETFSNEGEVTYTDSTSTLSSAILLADEWVPPSGPTVFDTSSSTLSFTSDPTQLQDFSTNGLTMYADAQQFITGALASTPTSITLMPAGQSAPLSASNEFTISYVKAGVQTVALYNGGALTLQTDPNTSVTISGSSTGSTTSEEWVLDSGALPLVVPAGSTVTYYYFDLLAEQASDSIVGGGTPTPVLVYTSALPAATSQPPMAVTLALTPATQYSIWVLRGSTASVNSPITSAAASEQWVTGTPQWTVSSADQPQFGLVFYHQYDVLPSFQVTGGGTGYSAPAPLCTVLGQEQSIPLGSMIWLDAGPACSYPSTLGGSGQSERWATSSSSVAVSAPGPLSPTYYNQFFDTIGYAVSGGGTGYGDPAVTCAQFGTQTTVLAGTLAWADAGSSCAYAATLPGSTQSERWATPTRGVAVTGPGPVSDIYQNQYSLGLSYTISGGGSPQVSVTGTSLGTASTTVYGSGTAVWLDAGTQYSLSNPLSGSSSSERWSTAATTSGELSGPVTFSTTYYHEFFIAALFDLVGGGAPTAPAIAYAALGSALSTTLTTASQSFWADAGSHYSVPSRLNGTALTERWSSSSDSGTVLRSGTLSFTYYRQYLLKVSGAEVSSGWYNASSTATLSLQDTYNRTAGVGERVTGYSLDGGTRTVVPPSLGDVTIVVQMNAPHQLSISSVQQYLVNLDSSTIEALASITPPTIAGDGHWYDQGTPVSLVLNGVWNRSAGSGERLVSYSLNGQLSAVATSGELDALGLSSISSPEAVSAVITAQYQLSTNTGSIGSVTAPPISGDAGWYDSGTPVTVVYDHSWNSTSGQSRANAVSYTTDNGAPSPLGRAANGTFSVQVTMSAPQDVEIQSATQYRLAVSGGNGVVISQPSPTGDSFYDSGSSVTVTTDYTWSVLNGNTRQNLLSYTLDGQSNNVTRADSGTFITPSVLLTAPQELAFTSATQYLISFQFKDSTGASTITPTSFQIQVDDPQVVNVTGSTIWLDSGEKYQVYSVVWEGVNVMPSSQTVYTTNAPVNQTVTDVVYAVTIRTTDYLGLPVSGAQASITLANGTAIHRTTSSDGTVNLGLIPLGTFHGSLSYLGTTTPISGDAATRAQTPVKVILSYPILGILAVIVVVVLAGLLLSLRRRHAPTLATAQTPKPEAEAPETLLAVACGYCGATPEPGQPFCQQCGALLEPAPSAAGEAGSTSLSQDK
ncbi:MAG: hypothetical protein OK456_02195 [Thaumarchaeota archaeon]|nr:hypothetical protein [Nitrososphaerota archaeon]